jgi:hypothetical protein
LTGFGTTGGNDEYSSGTASFGYADGGDAEALRLGLFLDQGGANHWPSGARAGQGQFWREDPLPRQPQAFGLGISE